LLGIKDNSEGAGKRLTILYARVSSQKQKEAGDLERQITVLKKHCPDHDKLIVDIASGLNFKRKGLLSILDLVEEGNVGTVVVTYRDRLARFGTDLIERIFRKHGTTLHLVSHDEDSHPKDEREELADDLLAVCNYFVAKNNGKRASDLHRNRQSGKVGTSKATQEQDVDCEDGTKSPS